jgi:hypothetical protein
MSEFPIDNLTSLSVDNPTDALIMAIAYINDSLQDIADKLDLLITATRNNL